MAYSYRAANPYKWVGQPATAQGVLPASAGMPTPAHLNVHAAFIRNRSGGDLAVALVALIPDAMWEAGQYVNATTTYTPDTTDAQDNGANDFALETNTVNDGHVFGCDVKFGAIGYDINTASIGAAQTHVAEYWNGTAWTAIAATGFLSDIPRTAGVTWTANEFLVLFDPPVDWVKGGTGTGINQDRYNLRIRNVVATTTAGLAKRIYLGQILDSAKVLATNTEFSRYNNPPGEQLPRWVAAIGAAFSVVDGSNNFKILHS